MKRIVFLLMILTILTKSVGFGREIILSYYYGATGISDAYLISFTIPTVIFTFIGVGIQTTYMPIYSDILNKDGIKIANEFTNNVANLLLIISSILIIAVSLFTEPIVKIFASGFTGETLNLAVSFTRIGIFSIYFIGLLYIFQGYLQLKNNFFIPALIGLPLNFFLIISIILSYKLDIKILGYGTILGAIAQLVFILPFLYKNDYRHKFKLNICDKNLKRMIYLALPVILGTSVNQINMLVDITIASSVAVGGISALNYAYILITFIQGIFVMSLATVLFATISKLAAEGNLIGLKKSVTEVINVINLLIIPATVGAMIFAEPVVKLLFDRGVFDSQAVSMTSYALFFYSIGMIGFGLREVLARAFYSLQDTKTPMLNAAIGMILNIILNIILSKFLGIGGIALATSISAIFTACLMFISLRKKIGPFGMKQISISLVKILFASMVMGAFAKLSFNYLTYTLSQNLSLIIAMGVGAVIYFIIICYMKIDDVEVIINAIKRKKKNNVA